MVLCPRLDKFGEFGVAAGADDNLQGHELVAFLNRELGTSDISQAKTYLEEPLRLVLHLIMSQPEYQLS